MPFPSLRQVEHVVDNIETRLRQSFNSNLKLVWSEHGDVVGIGGINLPVVQPNHYYYSDAIEPKMLPAIFILADRSVHPLHAQQFAMQEHTLFVAVLFEDKEYDQLTRKGWRYGEALFRTLHDASIGNFKVLVEEISYSPTVGKTGERDTRQFRKDVMARVKAVHLEAFP